MLRQFQSDKHRADFPHTRSVLLVRLSFSGDLVSDRDQNLSKVVAARHKAGIFPSVFTRSNVADATSPELFVPVVLRHYQFVAGSQEQ
jgi:hypothetical protein